MPEGYLILVLVAGVLGVASIMDGNGRWAGIGVLLLAVALLIRGGL